MMMVFFYMFFLIPLVFLNYWVFHFFLLFMMLIFSLKFFSFFFCSISYMFGVDYFSFWLILLSLFISCLMYMSFNLIINFNLIYFTFFNYFLCFILILLFSSLNMIYMYIFFELSLFPMLIIIFGWGYQPERLLSGFYLLFYTLFASLPLLFLVFYFYIYDSTFFDLLFVDYISFIVYFSSIFAFLVKFPMFIFHFWLPKAHVQAPVFGSMILAGLLLKMGGYGMIRLMFIMESNYYYYNFIWYSFCLIGCLCVSLLCFIQGDMKSLIANSSISHMMMCIMGLLSMSSFGLMGSFIMMIGHGFCSSGLFYISSICYDRLSSRSFFISSGVLNFNFSLGLFWFLLCCFNMGCPPSINFISEVMIFISMIFYWFNSFFFFFFISFFTACFSFYLYSYSCHGLYFNIYSSFLVNVRDYFILYVHIIYMFLMLLIMNFIFF